MILGLHWWAFILVCLIPIAGYCSALLIDSSNSYLHCIHEWKRMKVGDKYVGAYHSVKDLENSQGGHKMHIIVTGKRGEKPTDWIVSYDRYVDGKFGSHHEAKVFKSMYKFFNNYRRPDDYSCIQYLWAKHYKGDKYF